ncbi:MAG TPA: hypothetical protein VHK63_05590 [Candidatus Limnocylindria bacterium]|nr:hypothetical protein [Candidatus Limnocylindria bacterium]
MHPFVRNLVIGGVGLLLAAGLTAIAILGEDSSLSVAAMLAAGVIATGVGLFLFIQAWIWSQRTYRGGSGGKAVLIALAGGLTVLLAAVALAGSVVLVLTFYV